MKRFFLVMLLSFAALTFANDYSISNFSAEDVGTPDSYIQAEFGGELKTASPNAVLDIQKGRLFIRQKFEDPFGEEETVYQIYQGRAGDISSLTALQPPPSVSYAKLVNLKLYSSSSADAAQDIEKVYFDGKSVYVEGASTAFVSVNGSMVELKPQSAEAAPVAAPAAPAAPIAAAASSDYDDYGYEDEEEVAPAPPVTEEPIAKAKPIVPPKLIEDDEECEEDDPDCEEEYVECDEDDPDCEEEEEYDVAGDISTTNADADAMDYAASSAASDVKDRFGIADEVRFWSGVALAAVAAGSAVAGILQHTEANKASDAYDKLSGLKNSFMSQIKTQCAVAEDPGKCETAMIWDLSNNGITVNGNTYTLNTLNSRIDTNKKTMDSYTLFRNVWFGVTAVSLTASIVLFVW